MGMIERLLTLVFGNGGNVLRETAEVFRENTEAGAVREAERHQAALAQFGAEFGGQRGVFDVIVDGINRLPRPMLALGTIGLMTSSMVDPVWFSERMQGLALVPEALWWLMGAIVSFYFGARHQAKGQQFQREVAASMARVPQVAENLRILRDLEAAEDETPPPETDRALAAAGRPGRNVALDAWRSTAGAS